MAIRHGFAASSVALRPNVSIWAATNFNQELATLNATVSANGYPTTVKFRFSTDSNFSTYTEVDAATTIVTDQNVTSYVNISGLSSSTTYYFRCVANNIIGTTISDYLPFTTWALQVYERSTSGGTTFTIPTVTPTGGSELAVSIYDIIMFGAGGGGNFYYGGGGGASYSSSSVSLSGARSITTSVAAGGAGETSGTGSGYSPSSNTTITGNISTLTATSGSGAGSGSAFCDGSSGTGNCGGIRVEFDPDGSSGKGIPNEAYGGGGGAAANGSAGTANSSTTVGGTGGAGVSITSGGVTRTGGAGGGGAAYIYQNSGSQGVRGSNNSYGSGGNSSNVGGSAGQDGYIRFRYYAASALA